MRDTIRRLTILSFPASTPIDLALSSPVERTFSLFERIRSVNNPAMATIPMMMTLAQELLSMEPTDQANIDDIVSSSDQSLIRVLIALKMYITAIPAMIMVVGLVDFSFETMMIIAIGISEKMNAFATTA